MYLIMFKLFFSFITLLLVYNFTFAQNIDLKINTESKYLNFIFSGGIGHFMDQATSPLRYSGLNIGAGIGKLNYSEKKQTNFEAQYSIGYFIPSNGQSNSLVNEIELKYNYLRKVPIKNNKFKFFLGAEFNSFTDIRVNERLMNNSLGFESFATLFLSGKMSKDISRNDYKELNLLVFNIKLPPRKMNISLKQNVSVVNSTFRNHFIYLNHSFIVNENNIFDNYEYKLFSGFRISTQINYTHYLRNCNAIRVSYKWQAMQTAKLPHRFDFAYHKLMLSFLFKTN